MTQGFSQQKAGLEKDSGLVICIGLVSCSALSSSPLVSAARVPLVLMR